MWNAALPSMWFSSFQMWHCFVNQGPYVYYPMRLSHFSKYTISIIYAKHDLGCRCLKEASLRIFWNIYTQKKALEFTNQVWQFFFFLRATPVAYEGFPARGLIRATAASLCHGHRQQHSIRAASATYITTHGNARSLIHWARPGIKPTTSWF